VFGAMEEEDMSNKKGKRETKKKSIMRKQLEEGSLLQSNPCKTAMVVEVCCRCHELSIVIKVCWLHQDFLIFVYLFN
jgi:hypothetical protein